MSGDLGEGPDAGLRVVIVDDHPMFRLGLAASIEEMGGIELAGEAARADEVVDLVDRTSPDVMLLDLGLPDASGLEVNRWMGTHRPDVRVVLLTMSEELDGVLTALRDGASGYLVKGAGPDRVEQAVRAAAAGEVVLDRELARELAEVTTARRRVPSRPFPELTDREFEVLELVAQGHDNATIARTLVLSPKTVRNHVSHVLMKLDAPDRPGAIVTAHRRGVGL